MLQLSRAQALASALLVLAILVLLLAWRARRQSGSEPLAGGRSVIPAWRLGLSQAVSAYSLWILLGVSGAAYLRGLGAAWIAAGILVGAAINWFFVGPALRARAAGRLPVWLEATGTSVSGPAQAATEGERRGGWQSGASAGAAGIVLVILLIALVAQLRVAGSLLAQGLGIATPVAVVLLGVLAFAPAFIGGRRAAIDVATVLAILIIPAVIVLLLPAFLFAGAFGSILENAAAPIGGRGGIVAVLGFFAAGLALPGQVHVFDQFDAAAAPRGLRRAGGFAIAWFALLIAVMLMLGWSARVLYSDVGTADLVLVDGAQRLMPSFLHGLPALAVVAAVCAAAGHQLLTAVQAAAPHWLADGGPPLRRPRERKIRIVIAVLVVGVAAAIDFGSVRVVFFAVVALGAVIAPVLIANLAGAQWRRATVAIVVRTGLILTLLMFLAGR